MTFLLCFPLRHLQNSNKFLVDGKKIKVDFSYLGVGFG